MVINTIWLGPEIPVRYNKNIQRLRDLNRGLLHMHWQDRDILDLIKQSNLEDLYTKIPFISKLNLAKYLVLHTIGGVFTDLDIYWKIPFLQIAGDQNFNHVEIILSYSNYSDLSIENTLTHLLDDPFIITKPGLFK
jgi:mannosyltransferase OCH1-like enzyme